MRQVDSTEVFRARGRRRCDRELTTPMGHPSTQCADRRSSIGSRWIGASPMITPGCGVEVRLVASCGHDVTIPTSEYESGTLVSRATDSG